MNQSKVVNFAEYRKKKKPIRFLKEDNIIDLFNKDILYQMGCSKRDLMMFEKEKYNDQELADKLEQIILIRSVLIKKLKEAVNLLR